MPELLSRVSPAGIIGVIFGLFILSWLFAAVCMWMGAQLAGVASADFGRAFLVAFGCSFVVWITTLRDVAAAHCRGLPMK